ncbi:ABC transporter substrate-binding protein, partial [Pyrobaculum sp.]|uniref:ABC transporter substrate-binding protein n=1 Tax=Pyrobaculum sp. TaxID=2004705 RepID=UPI003D11F5AD
MASKNLYIGIIVAVVVILAIAALLATGGGQQTPTSKPTTPTPTPTTTQTTPTQTPTTTTPSPTQQKKTVYIGAALPLTGGLQSYGIGVRNAVELAVEDANKMCPGVKFELLVEDTGTNPQQALQKVQTLYAKGARLIAGPMASGEVSAVKSFADQNKIIIFSPSSTSPLLAIPNDWVYRIVPTDFAQAVAIADLLNKLGVKKAVILYRNDA